MDGEPTISQETAAKLADAAKLALPILEVARLNAAYGGPTRPHGVSPENWKFDTNLACSKMTRALAGVKREEE